MIMRKLLLSTLVAGLITVGFIGCNNPEQNFNIHPGDHLLVAGPTTLTLNPDTTTDDKSDRTAVSATYHPNYPSIKYEYKWSVSGAAKIDSLIGYKDHQNAMQAVISFPVTSADSTIYTINVDNGKHNGKLKVKVCHSTELTDNGFCKKQ